MKKSDDEDAYWDGYEEEEKSGIARIAVIFFIAVLAIGGIIVLAWVLYQEKTVGPEDTPIIRADKSPTKIKPQEPGGMVVANMDKTVYDKLSRNNDNSTKAEKLLPAPEEPVNTIELLTAAPANPEGSIAGDQSIEIITNTSAAKIAETDATEETIDASENMDTSISLNDAVTESSGDTMRPLTENDLQIVEIDKNSTPQPSYDLPQANNSGYKVQLAAFKTEGDAVENWQKIQKAHTDLLGKLRHFIERKEIEGKGTFYRLQAGIINKESEARLLCKKLAEVNQGCFVVE